MINIRYHIVSITAVFLALGIGVALGSTFFDRATADLLDRRINSAEKRITATNAENQRLARELDAARARDDALIVSGGEALLADQLTDVPTLLVTAPGVDKGDTEELTASLQHAGADLRGTLALRDPLGFTGDPDTALQEQLGLSGLSTSELSRAVHRRLFDEMAAAGADAKGTPKRPGTTTTAPGATTTTAAAGAGGSGADGDGNGSGNSGTTTKAGQAPDGATPPTLAALLARDYVRFDPAPSYTSDSPLLETTGYRYVFVGAPNLTEAQNDVLLSLLTGPNEDEALPGTVASATQQPSDGDPVPVPTVVARVRSDEALKDRYDTVDDLDTFAGQVAVIFTLENQGTVAPGHYGQADGASAVLPPTP